MDTVRIKNLTRKRARIKREKEIKTQYQLLEQRLQLNPKLSIVAANQSITTKTVSKSTLNDEFFTDLEANKNPKTVLEDAHITQGRTVTTYDVRGESGVKLTKPNGTAGAFTLLIARSPITGRIHTFVSDTRQETPQVSTMTEVDLKLCVNPDGLINVGIQRSGILVTKSAANSSAVKLLGSGQCV
jgi:hypothetical protein